MFDVDVLEYEGGFITYQIKGEEAHVIDFFIDETFRDGKLRNAIFRDLTGIFKFRGVKRILGQVDVPLKGSTRKLNFWLRMGCQVFKAHNDLIYLIKDI